MQQRHTGDKKSVYAASLAAGGKAPGLARLLGSATSGVVELSVFHPVDTVAKRLMSNTNPIYQKGGGVAVAIENANAVIFREAVGQGFFSRWASLFPGLGFAGGYKITQRIYKFGGQPFVKEYLSKRAGSQYKSVFGERNAKSMLHATAGSIVGIGEVALLPLDVLKIKAQTNPDTLKGRGIVDIFTKEGLGLYRGWGWTMARNAPGSFALFGGTAFAKEYLFGLKDFNNATFLQTFGASIVGAFFSLAVSSPLDVVKTRIQNRPFDAPESGARIVAQLLRREGPGAFFKGLGPKMLVVGPKLVCSFTIAQYCIAAYARMLD